MKPTCELCHKRSAIKTDGRARWVCRPCSRGQVPTIEGGQTPSRNRACPCGSGVKYKRCCGTTGGKKVAPCPGYIDPAPAPGESSEVALTSQGFDLPPGIAFHPQGESEVFYSGQSLGRANIKTTVTHGEAPRE